MIPAINFHIWKYCNFKCKFCFATYEDEQILYKKKRNLSENEMLDIIDEISNKGIEKITFAGGEPLLCKWLPNLIKVAKEKGLTTMIVTNGYLLTEEWINNQKENLDWITLSIDSINNDSQILIGRNQGNKKIIEKTSFLKKIELIKKNRIKFKLNTVVCSVNVLEDMSDFVNIIKPKRWKIFQVLPMLGQNDINIDDLIISNEDFNQFVKKHQLKVDKEINIVPENNDLMTGSYLMIDPQGRLYDNIKGKYQYSEPILKVGFDKAIEQIRVYNNKFNERKGLYDW